jgi:2-polyprenyl-6-methoxyphenol hydroxylase-like FAD-dependent oxidoreductase
VAVQREPLAAPRLGQRELDLALTQPRCDVLIIGGGPAGLATAIELRQSSDLDVVVVEARDDPSERFGESVPPDILLALDRLDLTQAFKADGHLPCPGSVSLWGRDKPGHNDFILNPVGPAWHISRTRFEAMLRTRATQMGASICSGTRARTVTRTDDHFDLVLQNPAGGRRAIHAPWVIDASGGRAWFARRQGATRRRLDGMLAIVRFAALRSGTFTAQTIVEAAPDGWWYCARLPDALVVTMLITERHAARTLTQGGYARWRELLSQTRLLAPRLDACGLDDERFRLYAVASAILDHVEGPGWIAVGDAASVYDPITSQGIHKALADAADASRTIAAAAATHNHHRGATASASRRASRTTSPTAPTSTRSNDSGQTGHSGATERTRAAVGTLRKAAARSSREPLSARRPYRPAPPYAPRALAAAPALPT